MKTFLTDQFLWDLYIFLEKIEDGTHFLLKPRRTFYDFGMENPVFRKYKRDKSVRQFSNLVYFLKKRNYIKVKSLEGGAAIMLTKKGIDRAIISRFKVEEKKFKKRDDGKWIMLIFDIPQKHNKARNLLRNILKNLKYKMFQQSVWITPYDVSEKTEELLQFYSLDSYVKIFLIEAI